tara:strand:+ start:3247 stop:5241 length:1995 start_codon:yes stop_codon:yes gene_type:complete
MSLTFTDTTYVWTGGYATRLVPKEAGFRWDGNARHWWTTDWSAAHKLRAYADEPALAALDTDTEEAAHVMDESRALVPSRPWDETWNTWNPDLTPMPFQQAGVQFLHDHKNALVGDEMGLGKTVQALLLLNSLPSDKQKVLIICPASLKLNWEIEFHRWVKNHDDYIINIMGGGRDWSYFDDVVIINPQLLKKHHYNLREATWDVMIVDECHYFKNPGAQRTLHLFGRKYKKDPSKTIQPIKATRSIFLTGTPILNRPEELFSVVSNLAPEVFPSWWQFVHRYCGAFKGRFGLDTSGATNLEELQAKLRQSVMIRRRKADVLTDLPAKRRQVIEVPAPPDLATALSSEKEWWKARQKMLTDLRASVELAKTSDTDEEYIEAVKCLREGMAAAFKEMAKLRQQIAIAKVPLVLDHLTNILETQEKVVVFTHHHAVTEALMDGLEVEKICAVKLDGRDELEVRHNAVENFQNDPDVRVFVGGIKAAGVGLTLTAASHVLFAEMDWTPANLSQAEDRCHRIGQTDSVLVQHIVLEASLDAYMANKVVEKQKICDKALDDGIMVIPEPVVPDPDPVEAVSSTKEAIAVEAEKFVSATLRESILSQLRTLSAYCDGARQLDGMGFSKVDADIGHRLAACVSLSPKQAALGARLTHKYRRQLNDETVSTQ